MSWKAMEVSMSKTRRGKYIDNRICHKGKCKGDMRFNLRGKGKLPCFSYLCEGNHFRFIEERYVFYLILPNIFFKICLSNMDFNVKSSNFHDFPFTIYGRFKILSYLRPRLKVFFVYCKIQKRAEVRSFPYRYLYSIGNFATS